MVAWIFLKPPHRLQIEKNLPCISFPKGSSVFKIYSVVFTSNFDGLRFLPWFACILDLLHIIFFFSNDVRIEVLVPNNNKRYMEFFGQNSFNSNMEFQNNSVEFFCKSRITWYLQWSRSKFSGLSRSSPSTPQFLALLRLPSAVEQNSTLLVACTTPARLAPVQGILEMVGSHEAAQRACLHFSWSCHKSEAV